MIINWYGGGCYKVQSSGLDIVVDPDSSESGKRLKGDLVLKTASPFPPGTSETEIYGPGEYEITGVVIRGAAAAENSSNELRSVYRVVTDGIALGFLGNTAVELDEKALDALGEIDILFVPENEIGARIAKSIGPKIVVPGWGKPEKISKELGQSPEPQDKLVIKRKDLDEVEGLKVVILES